MKNSVLLLVLCLAACGNASAQLYKTVNSSGQVTYTDRAAGGAAVTVIPSVNPTVRSTVEQASTDNSGKLMRVDMQFSGEAAKALVGSGGTPASNRKLGFESLAR